MHAPLNAAFRIEWHRLDALAALEPEWRALADRAVEPNVFYHPSFMLAAAPVFGAGAGAIAVRTAGDRLLGLFPARVAHWRAGIGPMLVGWTHPFAPLGVPLVDRNQPEAVIAAWLNFLGDRSFPPALLLPLIPETGAFAQALDAVLRRHGLNSARFGPHRRALLAPGAERETYLDRALSAGRRKELRRLRRRLEEVAPVSFATTGAPGEIDAALKDFCVLEASGWKGLAGTAIINDDAVKAFVQRAVGALAAEGCARIDRLFLNGRAIAAAITLRSGDTAWCWKIAYSEGVARFSPGVQLVLELTASLLANPPPARVDSCATADHPMIDHVWRERLPLSDRLIALRSSPLRFGATCVAETLRRAAVAAAKTLRDRLRR